MSFWKSNAWCATSKRTGTIFLRTADDGYLKATAFDLHSFYTGLERVFRLIAEILDGRLPGGDGWHKLLLTISRRTSRRGTRLASIAASA